MFSKILIANRGEIAVKIISVCKEMNISTVAVYSKADKNALHVKMADESYCIGPSPLKDSFLNMHAIMSVALATGAQAIHPGYGLLSENWEFALLCEKNGVCFIGPSSYTLKKMSDKFAAKLEMSSLGLPVVEGTFVGNSTSKIKDAAQKLGYPVIIKLRNGGGGKGIKVALTKEDIKNAVTECANYGKNYFGNKKVYVEKYISPASHIEVQIIADRYGNVLCLGERDCSLQIKNQKVVEETPCVKISVETRKRLFESCINAIKKIGYVGCGTIEFLFDKNENFYFLEINCRLQVEYAVTEMVTNLNLIKMQILVAFGEKLSIRQKDINFCGHAIECRINLNNLSRQNIVSELSFIKDDSTRFDTCLYENCKIPIFYDSLLGKLIVHGSTRKSAIEKMNFALDNLKISGVKTNIDLHKQIINNDVFKCAKHDSTFMNLYFEKKYLSAHERLNMIIDPLSFKEYDKNMLSHNILGFDKYDEKLSIALKNSSQPEAVIYGEAKINSQKVVIFVMDGNFMMGTMGTVVGEKVTKAFELAIKNRLPVIGVTVSGGARMQEGVFSLLQMVKTSSAVKKHSDSGLLYIAVITNPTLGGVAASFASVADIIIAEKNAVFGFSGKRIIEDVINKKLPNNFQTAEYNLKHGMIDIIVSRGEIRESLCKILKIHRSNFYEKNI